MDVKNYFIIPLGKCKSGSRNEDYTDVYSLYEEMVSIQIQSVVQNVKNVDRIIIVSGEYETTEELFYEVFKRVYELWNNEECNILCSGADVLFIKDVDIFGKYEDFTLFGPNAGDAVIDDVPISLDSLRYFPSSMEKNIFDMGMDLWNEQISNYLSDDKKISWEFEMFVFNKMFYTQRNGKYLDSNLTFNHLEQSKKYHRLMVDGFVENIWNPCSIDDASVLIFSATRGHLNQLNKMKTYHNQYNNKTD
jgi:hypothetical protein